MRLRVQFGKTLLQNGLAILCKAYIKKTTLTLTFKNEFQIPHSQTHPSSKLSQSHTNNPHDNPKQKLKIEFSAFENSAETLGCAIKTLRHSLSTAASCWKLSKAKKVRPMVMFLMIKKENPFTIAGKWLSCCKSLWIAGADSDWCSATCYYGVKKMRFLELITSFLSP